MTFPTGIERPLAPGAAYRPGSTLLALVALLAVAAPSEASWPLQLGVEVTAIKVHASASSPGQDPAVAIYVAGTFSGSTMIPTKKGMAALNSGGGRDLFVAKLDVKGGIDWITTAGGPGEDRVTAIDLDPAGNNIFLAGNFCGGFTPAPSSFQGAAPLAYCYDPSGFPYQKCSMTIGNSTLHNTIGVGGTNATNVCNKCDGGYEERRPFFANYAQDIFVAQLSSGGEWQLAEKGGGSLGDDATAIRFKSGTTSPSVILAGTIRGEARFGNQTAKPDQVRQHIYDDWAGWWCTPMAFSVEAAFDPLKGVTFNDIKIPNEEPLYGTAIAPRIASVRAAAGAGTTATDDKFYYLGIPHHNDLSDARLDNATRKGTFGGDRANGFVARSEGTADILYVLNVGNGAQKKDEAQGFKFGRQGFENTCVIERYAPVFTTMATFAKTNQRPIQANLGQAYCRGLDVDESSGDLYVSGFLDAGGAGGSLPLFGPGDSRNLTTPPGTRTLFVAKLKKDLSVDWLLEAGGTNGTSAEGAAVAAGVDSVYVGGALKGRVDFGDREKESVTTAGFVAEASIFGAWPSDRPWVVGEAVTPPAGADSDQGMTGPLFEPPGLAAKFYWSVKNQKLYPREKIDSATIKWKRTGGTVTNPIVTSSSVEWPANPTLHLSGAPVDLQLVGDVKFCAPDRVGNQRQCATDENCGNRGPCVGRKAKRCSANYTACTVDADCQVQTCVPVVPGFPGSVCSPGGGSCQSVADCPPNLCTTPATELDFEQLLYPPAGNTQVTVGGEMEKPFRATGEGVYSVLLYSTTTRDSLEVVHTKPADTPAMATQLPIGSRIADQTGDGKNGWVVNEKARYDATAYTRATRTGPILPVNTATAMPPGADLVVAHYRTNSKGVSWPHRLMKYDAVWPAESDKIAIGGELGSEGGKCGNGRACQQDGDCETGVCTLQPKLDPNVFKEAQVYVQNDPNLAGFNPNEEHAALYDSNEGSVGSGYRAIFALRTDLNAKYEHSEPYVLLKYKDGTNQWAMKPYQVVDFGDVPSVRKQVTVGEKVTPPYPLSQLSGCPTTCANVAEQCQAEMNRCDGICATRFCAGGSHPGQPCEQPADCPMGECGAPTELSWALFKDVKDGFWARAPGPIRVRFDYKPQEGNFFTEKVCSGGNKAGTTCAEDADCGGTIKCEPRTCEPFLKRPDGRQAAFSYQAVWPTKFGMEPAPPMLLVGETLVEPKRNLPAIATQAAVEVAFESTLPRGTTPQHEPLKLLRLMDALTPREVSLAMLPADIISEPRGQEHILHAGNGGAQKVPPALQKRVRWRAGSSPKLIFRGEYDNSGVGDPFLLPNVMTTAEKSLLEALSTDTAWKTAVNNLYTLSRNPNQVKLDGGTDFAVGLTMACSNDPAEQCTEDKDCSPGKCDLVRPARVQSGAALTAGKAEGTGWATLVFNNAPDITSPISFQVIQVGCGTAPADERPVPYQGQLRVLPPDNVFDEQVTIRHNADFAGDPSQLTFEWYYALKDKDCASIPVPQHPMQVSGPWRKISGKGAEVTFPLGDDPLSTLADTCVIARYTGYKNSSGEAVCENVMTPSQWAGAPLSVTQFNDPRAQLVPGWLSRVVRRLNPFDQRFTDFRKNMVDTLASALATAGTRAEGPVALNPDTTGDVGLIPLYATVLARGRDLSIDDGHNVAAVNNKLLDVAARVNDLYMLLGNEAYGDALDPLIGFDVSGNPGSLAPVVHAFQDQTGGPTSLLQEELALLRGRDGRPNAAPLYNRLPWNFSNNPQGGQLAYVQNYAITDRNGDGFINDTDAQILFPQGHGDAWGHYLTAIKGYYHLLRHPQFVWVPRSDSVSVAGTEVLIDYGDERRFATAAAARARSGAQIVDLTYRRDWVDDPTGQWQGYRDQDKDRAFGVFEWAQRAGQAAYLDWVTANALLPTHSNRPPGIEKIDRTTVPELREIFAQAGEVVAQLDFADRGMNPLGLAKNVVPFDINPACIDGGAGCPGAGTHFEQIAGRAKVALTNAHVVFDEADKLTKDLRRNQYNINEFSDDVAAQERDYNNRLIEIFGTPYREDIGPVGAYPTGYAGPDVYNWDYIDQPAFTGRTLTVTMNEPIKFAVPQPVSTPCLPGDGGTCQFDPGEKLQFDDDTGTLLTNQKCDVPPPGDKACRSDEDCGTCTVDMQGKTCPVKCLGSKGVVTINLPAVAYGRVKPSTWTERDSPGELQHASSELLQTLIKLERAIAAYTALIEGIECTLATLEGRTKFARERLVILNRVKDTKLSFNALILAAKAAELTLRQIAGQGTSTFQAAAEALPKSVGTSNDPFAPMRAAIYYSSRAVKMQFDIAADVAEGAQLAFEQAAEIAAQVSSIQLQGLEDDFEIYNLVGELGEKTRQEPVLLLEALELAERVKGGAARMRGTAARGARLIDELEAFRKRTANKVTQARYNDMTFRVFRNDMLQKYRAQLDLASRYVYLAAATYDYETNLLGTQARAGRAFLTDVVKERSLGVLTNGEPVAGKGLAGLLAQMTANFTGLKGQLGFNNPQPETNRFSLRREHFRILDASDSRWRSELAKHYVPDLWEVADYRRFLEPSRAEGRGAHPGIVIALPTTITSGLNFFGKEKGAGDSAYDSSYFSHKVRKIGVWFANYNAQVAGGLANTPNAYVVPVGADVLRAPISGNFTARNWTVIDQLIPAPSGITAADLTSRTWSPLLDTLDGFGAIRKYSGMRAYHDSGDFLRTGGMPAPLNPAEVTSSSRAIGRSVWNTKWLLVIPADGLGGNSPADLRRSLFTFIFGRPISGGGAIVDPDGQARDGNGIKDILLFFQTYSYSGSVP